MTNKKDKLIDPKTGEVRESSQFAGNENLVNLDDDTTDNQGGDYHTDTESRNPHADEADYISGPSAEGRRTRVDDLEENPSSKK